MNHRLNPGRGQATIRIVSASVRLSVEVAKIVQKDFLQMGRQLLGIAVR